MDVHTDIYTQIDRQTIWLRYRAQKQKEINNDNNIQYNTY